jgi:hypothetical protein
MARADRRGAQLSFELPRELLERLRDHAQAERRTVAGLLRGWIEAGLAGALEPSAEPNPVLVRLANRVEALERDVAQLQLGALQPKRRQRSEPFPAAEMSEVSAPGGCPPPAAEQEAQPAAPPAEGGITTAQLAERTGTNRSAWNNWARDKNPGAVRSHPQAGAWRLVGRAPAAMGGPPRCLWEPA